MAEIIAVRKNADGDLTQFKLDNGKMLNYDEALELARAGELAAVTIGKARNGRPVLRGVADGNSANNLDKLPLF